MVLLVELSLEVLDLGGERRDLRLEEDDRVLCVAVCGPDASQAMLAQVASERRIAAGEDGRDIGLLKL